MTAKRDEAKEAGVVQQGMVGNAVYREHQATRDELKSKLNRAQEDKKCVPIPNYFSRNCELLSLSVD